MISSKRPHVHHLKVVDADKENEVLIYAKWEVYPQGRPDLHKLLQPMKKADKELDDYGLLREAAHKYFCRCIGEMGKRPHIRKFINLRDSRMKPLGAWRS